MTTAYILADNGASSGSAGLKSSGGNDGTLQLQTSTSGGTATTAVTIDTSQNVGIGGAPVKRLTVFDTLNDEQAYIGYASGYAWSMGRKASDGSFRFYGYNGSSALPSLVLGIDQSITQSAPAGLGYGTGSGGTVTQATNKSTAVTLNKPTGKITMNNAALAAGATVAFTVTNSLASSNDIVVLTTDNNGSYRVEMQTIYNGGFQIRVTNVNVVSLSEALPINFAIIKGATS